MSYGKKDEDADTSLVKVDRTQVFQEGEQLRAPLPCPSHLAVLTLVVQRVCSTARPYKRGNAESS